MTPWPVIEVPLIDAFTPTLVSVFCPVPGETNRYVMVLPQHDGTIYVGLTDEPVEVEVPDVPAPSEPEIGFLATASGDAPFFIERFHDTVRPLRCRPSHLPLFSRTPDIGQFLAACAARCFPKIHQHDLPEKI